jgi:hypothetical protein
MNTQHPSADLSTRRRRLGASRETMAAGLGMPLEAVKAIEDGVAVEADRAAYDTWLRRIEAWPTAQRAQQFGIAGKGGRFEPETGS